MLGYGITNKFLHSNSINRLTLQENSRQLLKALADINRITSSAYMVKENGVHLVHREVPLHELYIVDMTNDRLNNVPLHCTASGKLYLAHLSEAALEQHLLNNQLLAFSSNTITSKVQLQQHLAQIRSSGVSIERGELADEISAIAVPIFAPHGALFGTISVTSFSSHIETAQQRLTKALQEACKTLSLKLF